MTIPRLRACWLISVAALSLAAGAAADGGDGGDGKARRATPSTRAERELSEASEVRRRANRAGVEAQKRIDALSDEADQLFARNTAALSQLDMLRTYNGHMRELVSSQDSELASLRDQLEQVDGVGRSVTPLMLRMIDALESFVALDVPFLLEERTQRVESLRQLMTRADVSVSEKFRVIMEAYQTEADYGRTIEAYRAGLQPGGDGATVDFLRFGRIALLYLSLDEQQVGLWDDESRSWQPLDASFVPDVRHGLRVARKQVAPDLITLPLLEPERSEPGQPGGAS